VTVDLDALAALARGDAEAMEVVRLAKLGAAYANYVQHLGDPDARSRAILLDRAYAEAYQPRAEEAMPGLGGPLPAMPCAVCGCDLMKLDHIVRDERGAVCPACHLH